LSFQATAPGVSTGAVHSAINSARDALSEQKRIARVTLGNAQDGRRNFRKGARPQGRLRIASARGAR